MATESPQLRDTTERARLSVTLQKLRSPEVVGYAEILIDDPASDAWLAHPDTGFREQVLAFHPGTVRITINAGPLVGRETTAVVYYRGQEPVLSGDGPFV